MGYNLLASAYIHPNSQQPYRGLFNKRSLESLARNDGCCLSVISPIPYSPPVGPYSFYQKVQEQEHFQEYDVLKPRFVYFLPKSMLFAVTGKSFQIVMKRAMANLSTDVVHGCHVFPDGYGLIPISTERSVPLTVTCHGYYLNNYSDLPFGVATQVSKTLNQSNHVFCVSDSLRAKASKIAPETEISTVPIGASPKNFPTNNEDELRQLYNISKNSTVVLFCGQFTERKGVLDIAESIASFPNEDVEYVFIGHGGSLYDVLKNALNTPDAPDSVCIMQGVENSTLRDWYAIADLLLLPSYAEGRPTVIYEAMAAETAVLSTRIEGVSEQVSAGKTGRLIQPGDQDALIRTLTDMIMNPEHLHQMGQNGLERLLSRGWTWEDHATRVITKHQSII
jgi:glycosyltransferase involved in cell wall biosynthesis